MRRRKLIVFSDETVKREGIIHLTIFWRILLLPIFIWWFLLQLLAFSFIGGLFISFSSINWKKDLVEALEIILIPIVAPFIWIFRYFYLGEFNILDS